MFQKVNRMGDGLMGNKVRDASHHKYLEHNILRLRNVGMF